MFNRSKNKNNKNSYKLLEKEEKTIENISLDNKKKKENQKITISSKEDKNKEKELKYINDIKDIKIKTKNTKRKKHKNKTFKNITPMSPSSRKNSIKKNNGIEDSNSINADNQSTFININSNSNSNTMIISDNNNSFSSVNPFSLNANNNGSNNKNLIVDEMRLDNNNKVIKEMASELEQSTAKKDIASNKKGEKFEVNKWSIEPVNLVKTIQEEKDLQNPSTISEKFDILFSNSNSMNENTLDSNIKTERINNNINFNSLINQKESRNCSEKSKFHNNKINAESRNEQKLIDKKVFLTNKKLLALEKYTKEKIIEIIAQINKLKLIYNYFDKLNDINSSLKEKNNSFNSFKGILSTNNNTDKTHIFKSLSIKNDDKNNIINFKKNKNGFDLTCSNFYRNKLYKIEPSNQKIFN